MSKSNSIILNSTNLVQGSLHELEFKFPTSVRLENATISLTSASFYNSFYNISAANRNNSIDVTFPTSAVASTPQTEIFSFPDSFMSIETINYFLQSQCILRNWYAIDADGLYVYFFNLASNSSTYGADIVFTELPSAAEATALGYTIPTAATWVWPTASTTMEFAFSQEFGKLIGFEAGTYPGVTTDTVSVSNTKTPAISTTQSIIVSCNLVSNEFHSGRSVASIPLTAAFGGLISYSAGPQDLPASVGAATYAGIRLTFQNQAYEYLDLLRDPDVVFRMVLTTHPAGK